MVVTNNNAKIPYEYNRYNVDEVDNTLLSELLTTHKSESRKSNRGKSGLRRTIQSYKSGSGRYSKSYFYVCCGFDIETYTDIEREKAIMYIWQFSINNNVIIGRTWEQFFLLLDKIKELINPTNNQRMLILDHNLSYEFGFMRSWLRSDNPGDNFFKEMRKPLKVTHSNFFEFRDTLALTNCSLKKLADIYTNTQKCVNDLDYSVPRTNKTILNETELGYCCNDVLILSEFADHLIKEYFAQSRKLPYTATGIINEIIKTGMNGTDTDKWHFFNSLKYPKTFEDYTEKSNYLYRGGFVHCDMSFCNETLTGEQASTLYGWDITSSYPYAMILPAYPDIFEEVEPTKENLNKALSEDKCVIFKVTFYNLKSTGIHSIESKHKCIELSNDVILDNGRIYSCYRCTVWLTELDYQNYCRFYSWSDMFIQQMEVANKCYIGSHIIKPMLQDYFAKYVLKRDGMPYYREKQRVNSYYGLNCKRLNIEMTIWSSSGFATEPATEYEDQIKKSFTSFYTGVYISAIARNRLLSMAYDLFMFFGIRSIYCDTDSHKFYGFNQQVLNYMNRYNTHITETNKTYISHFTEYNVAYDDLGTWDCEYPGNIKTFKSLGAKRYLVHYVDKNGNDHLNQTIAGLPKTALLDKYGTIEKCFENFTDNMKLPFVKTLPKYTDEPFVITVTDDQGHTVTQKEYSCIALLPNSFNMTVDELWLALARGFVQERKNSGLENRLL